MRLLAVLGGVAGVLIATASAIAQRTDDMPYRESPPAVRQAPSFAARRPGQASPLLAGVVSQLVPLGIRFEREARLNADPARFGRLPAGDEPSRSPDVTLAWGPSGGEGPGERGGSAPHPGGGGGPGLPGGGGHPGGTGSRRPGGVPGHHPEGHGRPPAHHPGHHPRGEVYTEPSPGYWWGYPGEAYQAPPPPPLYWYYCPDYGAYYPNVLSCPEWVLIPVR